MENKRFFQWIAGERRGEVVFFDKVTEEDGLTYVEFKDQSRVNTDFIAEINQHDLTGKMIAEIESPSNIWSFRERQIQNQPRYEKDAESGEEFEIPSVEEIMTDGAAKPKMKKVIDIIPPKQTMNKFGRLANSNDLSAEYNESIKPVVQVASATPDNISVPQEPTKSNNLGDPVYIMMEKSKKVDTEVNMTLTISLPSTHLFDVVRDSFDDGANKALEYIIENIDISKIKSALRDGIQEMYGPNEDPEDNKIKEDFEKKHNIKTEKQHTEDLINYEPEVVEEPIIKDAKNEEQIGDLVKELEEKAEKINQKNG